MKNNFANNEWALRILLALPVCAALMLFSGCLDLGFELPKNNVLQPYTWNPGDLSADSVSYIDDDSVTLYGHFDPLAFVIDVENYYFAVVEFDSSGNVQKSDQYLIGKNFRWQFETNNLYDTVVVSTVKIPHPDFPKNFELRITVKTPPESLNVKLDITSNSVAIIPKEQ